jgi:hypothetical protein
VVLKVAFPRLYSHSKEKLLYLETNANLVHTPVTQQLIETNASVTTLLPPIANKNLNINENNYN